MSQAKVAVAAGVRAKRMDRAKHTDHETHMDHVCNRLDLANKGFDPKEGVLVLEHTDRDLEEAAEKALNDS